MAEKKKNKKQSKDNLALILNLTLAIVSIALCTALVGMVMINEPTLADLKRITWFHSLAILTQVAFCILLFFVKEEKKDRIRAIICLVLYSIAMILAFISYKHYILFYITEAVIVLTMAINQFLKMEKGEGKKFFVANLVLGIALSMLFFAVFIDMTEYDAHVGPILTVILFFFISLKKIFFPTLKLERFKLLLDIMVRTHTIDVIVCLLAFMIAFSFILPRFETTITNFWDAMWYCFVVITTIGFGDFYATSWMGRLLTVVLGIYGIVVVAIITSVIVNFYNEISAKEKARDFIE